MVTGKPLYCNIELGSVRSWMLLCIMTLKHNGMDMQQKDLFGMFLYIPASILDNLSKCNMNQTTMWSLCSLVSDYVSYSSSSYLQTYFISLNNYFRLIFIPINQLITDKISIQVDNQTYGYDKIILMHVWSKNRKGTFSYEINLEILIKPQSYDYIV